MDAEQLSALICVYWDLELPNFLEGQFRVRQV